MGLIGASELDSLAHSLFAKEKADLVIMGLPDSSGVPLRERAQAIEEEHAVVEYRLVPMRVLEDAIETIKTLSENYKKLMEETAPLILEAARVPGNKWNDAMRLIGEATDWNADNLPGGDNAAP